MSLACRELAAAVTRSAERAGRRILELYESGCSVERKPDASPVTEADRAAEAIILPELAALAPDIPIVAEESVAAGPVPAVEGRFWLVDALDGTKEFIARAGEFTVNIALIEAGRPVLGIVHIPLWGDTYAGWAPGQAVRQRQGESEKPIAARAPDPQALILLASRSHGNEPRLAAFLDERVTRRGGRIAERRTAGSSLKFCLIAAGEADLYPRLGPTMEWDTAAGQAVLEAAGGHVETLDGAPLRYGKPDFRNPEFVARGR